MSVKNFIPEDGSLWSIRAVDISGNYGQRLLFDASGNAIVRTGNTDRLTIGNTGAWNVQGGMTYNNVSNTLTATTFSGALSGNATSATNIAGGAGGQIPYQSAASTTALLANGTVGQVLTSAGTTLAPTWTTPVSVDPTITDTNTDAVFYPTFVSGTGAAQTLRADATIGPFSINPSTGNFNVADTFKITQNAVALGKSAGITTQGASSVAIGLQAGQTTQGVSAIAIGLQAGQTTQTASAIAIGLQAGQTTQGSSTVAIGNLAGTTSQGTTAVAIGQNAGTFSQGTGACAIGANAGAGVSGTDFQGANAVAIGNQAGQNTQGANSIGVGFQAGQTTQGVRAVSIGFNAGQTTQGQVAIAIGSSAGNTSQGANNVAIGANCGALTQGASSVAIGSGAGRYTQGTSCVAVGTNAGGGILSTTFQGNGSVAIGTNAGQGTTTGQGANSIAIGLNAGVASQTAGSICLNASGLALNPSTASFYVNPIATTQQPAVTVVQERQGIVYNTTTSELTAGAFNTYSVCYNQIVQGSDKSFALTPVGTGITATVWQCTFVGERGAGSLPYLSTGIATFLGGVNRWTWAGYNGGGDFGTPTRFYGVVGSQLLWFSCGDFTSFDNVRFTFTRLY